MGARLSTSSGPATRDSFNGDNSIQPKRLSGLLRQANCSSEPLLSDVRSLTTASDQFKIFIIQRPREAHFPSGSIIPSRAKNNEFSRFSRREKSVKIFQIHSTLKDINIQRPAFKDTPARTSKNVQRSRPGNLSSNSKESFEFLLN